MQIQHAGNVYEFWRILERAILAGAPELVIIQGHGQQDKITFQSECDDGYLDARKDYGSRADCLKELPANSTIVLEACSAGAGREQTVNVANFFANLAPQSKIFASTTLSSSSSTKITARSPLNIQFISQLSPTFELHVIQDLIKRLILVANSSMMKTFSSGVERVLSSVTHIADAILAPLVDVTYIADAILAPLVDVTYAVDPNQRQIHCNKTPNFLAICNDRIKEHKAAQELSVAFSQEMEHYIFSGKYLIICSAIFSYIQNTVQKQTACVRCQTSVKCQA